MSRSQAQATTQGILGGVWPAVAGGACWMTAFLVIRPDPLGLDWAQVLLMLSPLVLVPLGLRLAFDDAVTGWLGPFLECLAAWLTALGGVLTAWLHLRLAGQRHRRPPSRGLWAISAVSLAASMILAASYGSRSYLPAMALDVPWMQALHGGANALGFGLVGFLAWTLDGAQEVPSGSLTKLAP